MPLGISDRITRLISFSSVQRVLFNFLPLFNDVILNIQLCDIVVSLPIAELVSKIASCTKLISIAMTH